MALIRISYCIRNSASRDRISNYIEKNKSTLNLVPMNRIPRRVFGYVGNKSIAGIKFFPLRTISGRKKVFFKIL